MSDFEGSASSGAPMIRHPKSEIRNPTEWRADLALVFNTLIWGSTFVMVKRALDDASALLYVAIRFLVATLVLACVFRRRWRLSSGAPRGGLLAGVCLLCGYPFQTLGFNLTAPAQASSL